MKKDRQLTVNDQIERDELFATIPEFLARNEDEEASFVHVLQVARKRRKTHIQFMQLGQYKDKKLESIMCTRPDLKPLRGYRSGTK